MRAINDYNNSKTSIMYDGILMTQCTPTCALEKRFQPCNIQKKKGNTSP